MKKFILGLILSSFLLVGTSCSTPAENATTSTSSSQKQTEQTATFSLIEDGKQIASKEVTISDSDTVLDVLKANFDVKEEGGFVTEIDNKSQDTKSNKYWMYYINDKEAQKGAGETNVSDKDKIEWRLNEFK